MPTMNRGAVKNDQPAPNPGAGKPIGEPGGKAMALPIRVPTAKDWQPTVVNLLILIILEMLAFAGLRYAFRQAHGG
jgi:hypothetical protein